jgi:23S rRNA (uracil1939-C5)-methyltransferase
LAALNDRICAGALPDFRGRTRLDVRLTGEWDDAKLQVLIRPDAETRLPPDALSALLAALREREEVAGIALARSDGSIETLWGELLAPTWVAGQPVWLAAASFFQTNLRLLPDLIARLKAESSPLDGKSIVDVYAGVGLFGLFLAGAAREVIAIESDALAVEAGKRTAGEWGLTNIRFVPRPAEEALTGGKSFDVVIVDPPRSGLTPGVIEALLAGRPPLLLYVSCLPQSLARDLQTLTRTYRLEHLELFDFYPQTYHVELLAVLRPELGKTSATA